MHPKSVIRMNDSCLMTVTDPDENYVQINPQLPFHMDIRKEETEEASREKRRKKWDAHKCLIKSNILR